MNTFRRRRDVKSKSPGLNVDEDESRSDLRASGRPRKEVIPGHVDVGSSLILYDKELPGLLGRRCELVSDDSFFSVPVIEVLVLWNGEVEVGIPICFTSTILLLAFQEIEGSKLSAAAKIVLIAYM